VSEPVKGSVRRVDGGIEAVFFLPEAKEPPPAAPSDGGVPLAGPLSHSPDFAAVNWYGTVYEFRGRQRLVVAALWDAMREGYHSMSQDSLLELAECEGGRLRDVFRGNPAWGTLIIPAVFAGGRPGAFRFAPPPAG